MVYNWFSRGGAIDGARVFAPPAATRGGRPLRITAAQLLLQAGHVDEVPVLGEFSAGDAPDVDGAERHPAAGRRDAEHHLRVRRREHVARHQLAVAEDAVLD